MCMKFVMIASMATIAGCSDEKDTSAATAHSATAPARNPSNDVDAEFDALLKAIVDADGWVRYSVLAEPERSNALANVVKRHAEAALPKEVTERKAFLCNAYNANVLHGTAEACLDPAFKTVKDVPGFFDHVRVTVAGQQFTLDELKTSIRQLGDPRIHAALVFGARGCPPLRSEPYAAARLDEQFDQQSRRWVDDGRSNLVKTDRLAISEIFKWHESDFAVEPYKGVNEFLRRNSSPAGMIRWYLKNAPEPRVEYSTFNWRLNRSMEEIVSQNPDKPRE